MRLFSKKDKQFSRREIVARRRSDVNHVDDARQSEATVNFEYRRSQTLSKIRSAMTNNSSERQDLWKLRRKRRKAVGLLSIILVSGLVIISLLFQFTASVKVQTPDAMSQKNASKYSKVLEDYYATRPFERLRFALDQTNLNNFFNENVPEVKTVRVVGDTSLGTSNLQLTFRTPVVQWASGGKIYFVDNTGITFETSYSEQTGIKVNDMSGIPSYAGQEIINKRFLSFLGKSVTLLGEKGLVVTEANLPADTVRQVEFKIRDKPYLIKMTVDRSPEAQSEQASIADRYLLSSNLRPEYLDVRVNQSVFYK